jgi:hypothetical protein
MQQIALKFQQVAEVTKLLFREVHLDSTSENLEQFDHRHSDLPLIIGIDRWNKRINVFHDLNLSLAGVSTAFKPKERMRAAFISVQTLLSPQHDLGGNMSNTV